MKEATRASPDALLIFVGESFCGEGEGKEKAHVPWKVINSLSGFLEQALVACRYCPLCCAGKFEVDCISGVPCSTPGFPGVSDILEGIHRRDHEVEGFSVLMCRLSRRSDGEAGMSGQKTTV